MEVGYPNIALPPGCPWSNFQPPTIKYCEENICAWITTPANTWSNLAYIFVGIWVWKNFPQKKAGLVFLFGPAAIGAGVTSFLYHASYTFIFQIVDYAGMYMLSGLLLSLNLRRFDWIKHRAVIPVWIFLILVGVLPFALSGGANGRATFGLQIIAAFILEFILAQRSKKAGIPINYRMYWASLAIFFISYAAWWIDAGHLWCDPTNHFIQSHAIWHVVNSFCFLTMAKFYQQFKKLTS